VIKEPQTQEQAKSYLATRNLFGRDLRRLFSIILV